MCDICKKTTRKENAQKKYISKKKKIANEKKHKKIYREKYKDRLRAYNSTYIKERRKNDYIFHMKSIIASHNRRKTIRE